MSRDEAIENLAQVLKDHYPHPVFGCECVIPDLDDIVGDGRITPLEEDWSIHVAEIALEAAKGF